MKRRDANALGLEWTYSPTWTRGGIRRNRSHLSTNPGDVENNEGCACIDDFESPTTPRKGEAFARGGYIKSPRVSPWAETLGGEAHPLILSLRGASVARR